MDSQTIYCVIHFTPGYMSVVSTRDFTNYAEASAYLDTFYRGSAELRIITDAEDSAE